MRNIDHFSCREVFRRLDDYLDRELSAEEMEKVRSHLDDCVVCAAEYRFERHLLDGVKEKVRRIAAPRDLLTLVQAAIARARADSGV
jgi:anti-sigma factor (TIGR02949 family)